LAASNKQQEHSVNTLQSWYFIRPLVILLIVCAFCVLASAIRAIEQRLRRPETPARAMGNGAMTAAKG